MSMPEMKPGDEWYTSLELVITLAEQKLLMEADWKNEEPELPTHPNGGYTDELHSLLQKGVIREYADMTMQSHSYGLTAIGEQIVKDLG